MWRCHPFAISITEQGKVRPHDNGVLDQLLHAINQSISIIAPDHPVRLRRAILIRELCVCFGYRRLVRDGEHTHPPT